MRADGLYLASFNSFDATVSHPIETFQFVDGTVLTFDQLFTRGVKVFGTSDVPFGGVENLSGTFADDEIFGFGGRDSLFGGAGNDTLIGGSGDDVLEGGLGGDTYVFRLGDGVDHITDGSEFIPPSDENPEGELVDNNRILFGAGITLGDLTFVEGQDGITIQKILVGTEGDAIFLPNFPEADTEIRAMTFSDGLTVDIYDLVEAGLITEDQIIQGGQDDSTLIGGASNDTIVAGAGNTSLVGGSGNDTLQGGAGGNRFYGGPGNDLLVAGSGGNTFIFSIGSG